MRACLINVPDILSSQADIAAEIIDPEATLHHQKLILAHDVLAAGFHVVLVYTRLDDGVYRARFLAEAAVNAFKQVDVIAGRPPGAVFVHIGLDGNRERWAHGFAQLAGYWPNERGQ